MLEVFSDLVLNFRRMQIDNGHHEQAMKTLIVISKDVNTGSLGSGSVYNRISEYEGGTNLVDLRSADCFDFPVCRLHLSVLHDLQGISNVCSTNIGRIVARENLRITLERTDVLLKLLSRVSTCQKLLGDGWGGGGRGGFLP